VQELNEFGFDLSLTASTRRKSTICGDTHDDDRPTSHRRCREIPASILGDLWICAGIASWRDAPNLRLWRDSWANAGHT